MFGETSEHRSRKVCATRGVTKEASDKFMKTWSAYNDFILKEATDDLSESQPTAGNIAGGLTTIEEKLLETFKKLGTANLLMFLTRRRTKRRSVFHGYIICSGRMCNSTSCSWF